MNYLIVMTPSMPAEGRSRAALVERLVRLTGLQLRHEGAGLTILADQATALTCIGGKAGAIIGHIYSVRRGSAEHDLERLAEKLRTCEEAARFLITECWGAYIACLHGKDGSTVLRDPSAQLPCYQARVDGHHLFASDTALLLTGIGDPVRVDEPALRRFLLYPELREQATCLVGISELSGRAMAHVDCATDAIQVWNPWDHVGISGDRSSAQAADRLANVVTTCVARLTSPYRKILLDVSGGLDSSIVAAALRSARRDFSCLTMFTQDPSGDERAHSRVIADHCGITLEARCYESAQVSVLRAAAPHLPRPNVKMFKQAIMAVHQEFQRTTGIDAVFGGNGGDNVFCYLHSSAPVTDRMITEGPFSAWPQTVGEMSAITGCSMLTIFHEALVRLARATRPYTWRADTDLLVAGDEREPATFSHPWLLGGAGRPYGKTAHVALLLRTQNHLEGYPPAANLPVVNPVLAQPIVETCLGIPTWQWCESGINRSVARQAFASRLPERIVRRTSKSGPDSFIYRVFEDSKDAIRPFLCEGFLAQARIVDVDAIDAVLRGQGRDSQMHHRLLMLCDAEAWSRSWLGRRIDGC